MSSLIANEVKTNMCLDSIKLSLLSAQTEMPPYTIITIRFLFLSAYKFFASKICSEHNRNFTQDGLNSYYCRLLYSPTRFSSHLLKNSKNSKNQNNSTILTFSGILSRSYLSIPFSLMLVIISLLGTCFMYLLVCILFTLFVVSSYLMLMLLLNLLFIVLNFKRY